MSKAKYCRSRQKAPRHFEKGTLRTTSIKSGVKKITGCPKGSTYAQKKGGGCRTFSGRKVSTQLQTILYKAGSKACPLPGGKELPKGFPMRKKNPIGKFAVGSKYKISEFASGVDKGKIVTILPWFHWREASDGTYRAMDPKQYAAVRYAKGTKGFVLKSTLREIPGRAEFRLKNAAGYPRIKQHDSLESALTILNNRYGKGKIDDIMFAYEAPYPKPGYVIRRFQYGGDRRNFTVDKKTNKLKLKFLGRSVTLGGESTKSSWEKAYHGKA